MTKIDILGDLDLDHMHLEEIEFWERQARKNICAKLLELLEQQQRIIARMIDLCKEGESTLAKAKGPHDC